MNEVTTHKFLYVVQCCNSDNFVKIGITSDEPLKRLLQLQTGNPYELRMSAVFEVGDTQKEVERMIHTQLKRFHIRGEWFKLTPEQAVRFVTASLFCVEKKANINDDTTLTISTKPLHKVLNQTILYMRGHNMSLNAFCREAGLEKSKGGLSYMLKGIRPLSDEMALKLMSFFEGGKTI